MTVSVKRRESHILHHGLKVECQLVQTKKSKTNLCKVWSKNQEPGLKYNNRDIQIQPFLRWDGGSFEEALCFIIYWLYDFIITKPYNYLREK